jgi:hypothetical protein
MHCPYCQVWIAQESASCPSCGLNVARADALLGPPPPLSGGIEDLAALVSSWQMRGIRRKVDAFQRQFPQVMVHVCVGEFPIDQPFELYAFWLFNRGAIGSSAPVGAENFDMLLVIDPQSKRAATMLGYGWENLLQRDQLQAVWSRMEPYVMQGKWQRGFLVWLDFHRQLFVDCWNRLQTPAEPAEPSPY